MQGGLLLPLSLVSFFPLLVLNATSCGLHRGRKTKVLLLISSFRLSASVTQSKEEEKTPEEGVQGENPLGERAGRAGLQKRSFPIKSANAQSSEEGGSIGQGGFCLTAWLAFC